MTVAPVIVIGLLRVTVPRFVTVRPPVPIDIAPPATVVLPAPAIVRRFAPMVTVPPRLRFPPEMTDQVWAAPTVRPTLSVWVSVSLTLKAPLSVSVFAPLTTKAPAVLLIVRLAGLKLYFSVFVSRVVPARTTALPLNGKPSPILTQLSGSFQLFVVPPPVQVNVWAEAGVADSVRRKRVATKAPKAPRMG